MNDSNQGRGGSAVAGLSVLLGTVLVTLKLSGVIDWPWVGVLAPFWVPMALGLAVLLALVVALNWSRW